MRHLFRSIVVIGVLALPATAFAQVYGGVRAGINFADLAFEPTPPVDSDALIGLVGGAFVVVPLNDIFAFQPEVLYSRQGTKFSEEGMTVRTKVDYAQFPVLARVRVARGSPIAILAGPSFGAKTGASIDGPGIPDEFSREFEASVRKFDFGFVAGMAAELGHFVVDGRYTWGLTNIAKKDAREPDNSSAKNRVLSLSAGLRF